jgi:hypothetical protein
MGVCLHHKQMVAQSATWFYPIIALKVAGQHFGVAAALAD